MMERCWLGLLLAGAIFGACGRPSLPFSATDAGIPFCSTDLDCGPQGRCFNHICVGVSGEIPERRNDSPPGEVRPPDHSCEPGTRRPCYSGPQATKNVGSCREGEQICASKGWASCVGESTPSPEECNNKDDDCDGEVDEGLSRPCHGPCGNGKETCHQGAWQPCTAPQPGPEECNGKDDDCDGQIDEAADLSPPLCSVQEGVCRGARRLCAGRRGWRDCTTQDYQQYAGSDYQYPESSKGRCDGKDNDCDGQTDENCSCSPGKTESCYSGPSGTQAQGPCKGGQRTCLPEGKWGPCQGEVTPSPEECNGKDDDCDGQTDEELTRPCQTPCGSGKEHCRSGKWSGCTAPSPSPEICDGKDNNCDGSVDENNPNGGQPCSTGKPGLCQKGKTRCEAGQLNCEAEHTPSPEKCNGQDDDCDGQSDEDNPESQQPCTVSGASGVCKNGVTSCFKGALRCQPQVKPSTEICDNGKDDDCDGVVDENPPCACKSGQKQACYEGPNGTAGQGLCQKGTQTCLASNQWSPCLGQILPQQERCDNKDNDCDGRLDDNLTRSCKTACGKGSQTCRSGKWSDCSAPQPQRERCDNKDNDCDGFIDNSPQATKNNSLTRPCSTSCGKGTQTCQAGKWQNCVATNPPQQEKCNNNKDDDCDGLVDEECKEVCERCSQDAECKPYKGHQGICFNLFRDWNNNYEKACLLTCRQTSDCPRGFHCRRISTSSGGARNLCLSAYDSRWPYIRWTCQNYRYYKQKKGCRSHSDCGWYYGYHGGGRCRSSTCTLYCRQGSDCPSGSCSNGRCNY